MSDRHDKWTRVEPGTVIPAGQPYRIEFPDGSATESPNKSGHRAGSFSQPGDETFIDSSWKPPLDLPTEPTWGIAVLSGPTAEVGRWIKSLSLPGTICKQVGVDFRGHSTPLDFIPLTDEQVARIEAAR